MESAEVSLLDSICKNDFEEYLMEYIVNQKQVEVTITENLLSLNKNELHGNIGNWLTRYYNIRGIAKYLGFGFNLTANVEREIEDPHQRMINDRLQAYRIEKNLPPDAQVNEEEVPGLDMLIRMYRPQHADISRPKTFIDYFQDYFEAPSRHNHKLNQKLYEQYLEVKSIDEFFQRCSDLRYPHECLSFWTLMFDEMKVEIKQAINKYMAEKNIEVSYKPNTCVIHSRMTSETVLAHAQYGPNAFSLYLPLIQSCREIVLIYFQNYHLIKEIHDAMEAYILHLNPQITLSYREFQDPLGMNSLT